MLLTAAYLCVVLVGIWHHELWRDEWQAWMLARDSESLLALMRSLAREGHSPVWYGLLYLLAGFTRNPLAMQVAHMAIAAGSVYLLARHAPFPWTLRILAAFGYFLAYEYAVLARPYALGVLGLFLFCVFYSRGRRRGWGIGLSLLLLALSSVYGLILAVAAVGMLLAEDAGPLTSPTEGRGRQRRARVGLAVWLAAMGAVVVVLLVLPLNFLNEVPGTNELPLLSRWGLASTVGTVAESYLPLPDLFSDHLRETHVIGAGTTLALALLLGLSLLLVAASTLMFLRTPPVLFFYVAGTGGLLLFSHLVFRGFMRHHGHLYLLFLACLWLARDAPTWRVPSAVRRWSGPGAPWARHVVAGVLIVQVLAAGTLYAADIRRPFSTAGEVATFLRSRSLDDLPILVHPGPPGSSVAGALDRPVHYQGTRTTSTFIPWNVFSRRRDRALSAEYLRRFLDAEGPVVLVILSAPRDEWDQDLDVEELARFDAGLERTEKYVVYRVEERR